VHMCWAMSHLCIAPGAWRGAAFRKGDTERSIWRLRRPDGRCALRDRECAAIDGLCDVEAKLSRQSCSELTGFTFLPPEPPIGLQSPAQDHGSKSPASKNVRGVGRGGFWTACAQAAPKTHRWRSAEPQLNRSAKAVRAPSRRTGMGRFRQFEGQGSPGAQKSVETPGWRHQEASCAWARQRTWSTCARHQNIHLLAAWRPHEACHLCGVNRCCMFSLGSGNQTGEQAPIMMVSLHDLPKCAQWSTLASR
jgi:hypothetical protein